MLRLRDGQGTLWEEFLPPEIRVLSDELTAIDALLDDDGFMDPFAKRLKCDEGRPTIPMEPYLRMMFLKHRHSLGYETLAKEVTDSLSWRRFCRIRLDGAVPHPTTLSKLTKRVGPDTVEDLNRTLLRTAVENRVLRSRRVRVDTTAMEADVRYPTDSGLCAHAVSRLSRTVSKVKKAGLATRTRFRNRRRSAGKIIFKISHALSGRPKDRWEAVQRMTAEVHRVAKSSLREARHVLASAERGLSKRKTAGYLVTRLKREVELAERVVAQTARRLAGERSIPDRMVSLGDRDARPIVRGKPQKPVEFGYKVSIADTPEGFVVAHQVYKGNPADAQTLEAAIRSAQQTGMKVDSVFADRGYGDSVGDEALTACGITNSVIPRKGRPAPREHTRSWRLRYRWRAGGEGRISALKRERGLRRTRLKGHEGAQIWAGMGVFASNVTTYVALG